MKLMQIPLHTKKTKEICGDTTELQELYSYWIPKDRFDYEEHKKVFCLIDDVLSKKGYEY